MNTILSLILSIFSSKIFVFTMRIKQLVFNLIIPKFKSFCKHSTVHGVYYFYKSTNWCVHVVWSSIIVCSIVLCCFLGHMIFEKFVIDPTLTVVETTHYAVANIPFPAITVCDNEQVSLPQTKNITDLFLLRGFNNSEIQVYYKSFADLKRKDYVPEPFVKKMHLLLEDLGYSMKILLQMFKRPCSDMIMECSWRSMSYDCSEMFRSVWTVVGYCCQFDVPYFSEHTEKDVNFIAGVATNEALDIIVLGTTPVDGNDPEGHSKLYIHDIKDKVTIIDGALNLIPESYFDVNVNVWAIHSSVYVKALPLKSRKCILETDQGSDAGFYQGCMSRLVLQRVVQKCKCLPFDYTAESLGVSDYSACSWERLICIYQGIELIQVDLKDIIAESNCYQRCDYVQYDAEVEFIKNQRHLGKINQNRSRVFVHFSETTCMKYRREVLYTWDQMLANLGGIFGLCLGGSMISVIEICWFIIELFCSIIAYIIKNPDPSPPQNKVFTITQKEMVSKKMSAKHFRGKYKFVN